MTITLRRRGSETRTRSWHAVTGAALASLVLAHGAEASGVKMPVEPGDVLRVTILEAPAMDRDAPVGADGRIMIPRLGGVEVAGRDLDAVREQIAAALVTGKILNSPTVVVEVASYRPFYIGGTVAKPGSISFQPGLTVRHAVILAGGLDRSNGADRLSTAGLLELKAKWRATNYKLVAVRADIARLQAELAGSSHLDISSISDRAVKSENVQAVTALVAQQFDDEITIQQDQKAHYRDLLSLIDLEIAVLTKQGTLEEKESELQGSQVGATRALVAKGLAPQTRLQDLERERSRLTRDMLDNHAYTARARQNKVTQQYDMDVADIRRRIELRKELASAELDRLKLQSDVEIQSAALLSAGIALADTTAPPPDPTVTIHRVTDGREQTLVADMDTPIRPGDVLEVSFARVPQG